MSMMITKLRVSSAAGQQYDYQRGVERLKKLRKRSKRRANGVSQEQRVPFGPFDLDKP